MRPFRAIVLGLSMLAAGYAPRARAAGACEADHLHAQEARASGKLLEARDTFLRCAASTCPNIVQRDCVQWLDEVDADLPTVVPSAHTSDGRELGKVSVELDGQPWVESLDGKAIPVDPGSHTLRFESDGFAPVDVEVIAKMGAKNEPAVASFAAPGPAGRPRAAVIATWTLVGFGSASVLAFAGVTIAAELQYQDLQDTCAPACADEDVNSVRAQFIAGDTLAIVGGACLVSALVIYFAIPAKSSSGEPSKASIGLRPVAGGGAASFSLAW